MLEEKKKEILEKSESIYLKFNQDRYNTELEKEFEKVMQEKRNINEEISILEKALNICEKYK
jgi:hypothetical protein